MGKHHGEDEDAQKLGIEIISEMWDLTKEFPKVSKESRSYFQRDQVPTPMPSLAKQSY